MCGGEKTESVNLPSTEQLCMSESESVCGSEENSATDSENLVKQCLQSEEKCASIVDSVKISSNSSSSRAPAETECARAKTATSSPQSSTVVEQCNDRKKTENSSQNENDLIPVEQSEDKILSICKQSVTCTDDSLNSCESDVRQVEPMDTENPESHEQGLCDKVSADDKPDNDRKRAHESVPHEVDDSQPVKRSRLDEVIGKLGERVTFPSAVPEIDNFDYEDDAPGDADSVEKQSEEVSGSTSDEEEDKTAEEEERNAEVADNAEEESKDVEEGDNAEEENNAEEEDKNAEEEDNAGEEDNADDEDNNEEDNAEEEDKNVSDSTSNTISITKQGLETIVQSAVKTAVEKYQSTELMALTRRLEELQQSQEDWRQKAKDLERQVLDLTVLQQRLEKRKAHTAALKSITTRSIGIWVTEDKFKGISPQKHVGNRTPPATPPVTTQSELVWTSSSQPSVRSAASISSNNTSAVSAATPSITSRNTSVAHLLSQTARMPTVASCAAASRPAAASKSNTSFPRLTTPSGTFNNYSASLTTGTATRSVPATAAATPVTSLVLVNAVPSQSVASKQGAATTLVTPTGNGQVKVIDLTMEDESSAPKRVGKVMGPGGVRAMVPQQMVRQITPMSQTVPVAPSSAILLSSPAGTQIVNANSIPRPGMLQVVTIANPQSLRPGSIFTVVPGQGSGLVRPPAVAPTFTTNARDSAPLVMTQQQLPQGVTFVRPPPSNNLAGVRPSPTPSNAGAPTAVATARAPGGMTASLLPHAAAAASGPVQPDGVSLIAAQSGGKKPAQPAHQVHPAPLPDSICPKGLSAGLKPPPPCPGLKISRVKQGIVLSWNMTIPPDCVEIASYQLFAYQETNAIPQTSLWKKVGDVKALPLPMACTLTQFQDGNKYHFAVRAVDIHGRSGPFSDPSYIFLTKAA